MEKTSPKSIDAYIKNCSAEVRVILEKLRATIRAAAPDAEERISYRMPAFFQDGVLIYFAAFTKHIGVFPPVSDAQLKRQVAKYAGPKGNLQFPLAKPIPYALIAKLVKARLKHNVQMKAQKR